VASAIDDGTQKRYRSGDAARLANMPVTTLRIWERRYGVVAPPKSESGQRRYSEDDVRRLALLKALVQRIETENFDPAEAGVANMACFASLEEACLHPATERADVLMVSVTSLHEDVASQVLSLGEAYQARAIAVAYGFGTGRAIQMLRLSGARLYREPDSRIELRQVLEELARTARGWGDAARDSLWLRAARRFDDQTLAAMAARSSTIACECPRHLAELIMKLSAFEKYSDECGSRSVGDMLLHRNLGDVANRALAMFESALSQIAHEEGLLQERRDD